MPNQKYGIECTACYSHGMHLVFLFTFVSMKYWIPLLSAIFITSSCGLFSKKAVHSKKKTDFFTEMDCGNLKNAITFEYAVVQNENSSYLSVFPYNNSGYTFDYRLNGEIGFVNVSDSAKLYATKYVNEFGKDSLNLNTASSVWLSQKNYLELKINGKTSINTGAEGEWTYRYVRDTVMYVNCHDTLKTIHAGVARAEGKPYTIVFIRDKNYPLILAQKLSFNVNITEIVITAPKYNNFTLGEGAILRYRITENGFEEYQVTIKTMVWTDTARLFRISGTFAGSYEYEFNYLMKYTGEAIQNPIFDLPAFSPSATRLEDRTKCWFIFGNKQMADFVRERKGFLPIAHFQYNPDEMDTTTYTPKELEKDRKLYRESWRTYFTLGSTGRIMASKFEVDGSDIMSNPLFPGLNLNAVQNDLNVIICHTKNAPFLLYYNDNMHMEITLTFAGYEE